MGGIADGVSKVFILCHERGFMNLDGFKSRKEMLTALLYRILSDGYEQPETAIAEVESITAKAIAVFRKDYECEIIP